MRYRQLFSAKKESKNLVTTQSIENTEMLANISSQLRSSHDSIQKDLIYILVHIISEIQDLDRRLQSSSRSNAAPIPTLSHSYIGPGSVLSTRDLRTHADAKCQSAMRTNPHGTTMAMTRACSWLRGHQIDNIYNILIARIERIFRLAIAYALVALQEFLVRARAIYDAGCPNCLTSNTSSCSATTSRCHSCGRVFSRSFDTNIIPTYGDTHSIQALGYPHGAGRTPRKIAGRYELELLKKWLERSRSQSSEDGDRQLKDTFDDDLAKSDSDTVSSNDTTTNADQGSSDSERRK